MNIDRVFLPIDDEHIQDKVKVLLTGVIIRGDILDYGCENVICDKWDEKAGKMGKAFTGEQILLIRVRGKDEGGESEKDQA